MFGEGAEVWWGGLVGVPIGGTEDDPEPCAEVQEVAAGDGNVFLGAHGRSFVSSSLSVSDNIVLTGHSSGARTGSAGTWPAASRRVRERPF